MQRQRRPAVRSAVLGAALALGLAACELLFPPTDAERCAEHCARLVECGVEDASAQAACQDACGVELAAGREPAAMGCSERVSCDGVLACVECLPYCDKFASCNFGSAGACVSTCEADHRAGRDAPGEACVIQEDCDEGSLCILCDQYCRKLDSCQVSTEPACASSCVTLLQAGADATPYQCVVDSPCAEVPNCGI